MNRINVTVFAWGIVFILCSIIRISTAICNVEVNLMAVQITRNLINRDNQIPIPLLSGCQSQNLLLLQAKKDFLSDQRASGIAQMMTLFQNSSHDFAVKIGLGIIARDFAEKNELNDAIYFFSLADDIASLMGLGDAARANQKWDVALQAYQTALNLTDNREHRYLLYINLARVAWYGYQDIGLADEHLRQAHLALPQHTYVCQIGFRLWTAAGDSNKAAQWQSNCTP